MIKVAITDDHPVVIDGLRAMLETEAGFEIVACYRNAGETEMYIGDSHPDVLLLDINLPDKDGVQLCTELKKQWPAIRIIALTTFNQAAIVKNIMAKGADGYIVKSSNKAELIKALTTVVGGDEYLHPEILKVLLADTLHHRTSPGFIPKLTRREKEILKMIIDEMTTHEIADQLCLSPKTVESHRLNLIQKLGVRNTAGLVKIAIEKGLTN
jgi:DNA-binding NarL/FixJ family response regulator